ncbi:MAG: hypothetical protein ISS77_03690 [Phycisphaerae bacterium]|nr:hypothetical protein [Phycisphaerae bacterium]
MQELLNNIMLAARKNDESGWTQLLVFAVMAVVWILGGIIKARQNKITDKDFAEEQEDEKHKIITLNAKELIESKKIRHAPTQIAQKPENVIEDLAVQGFEKVKKKHIRMPEFAKAESKSLKHPEHAEAEKESLLRINEPDELKKAIIYAEIIGKPLALRQ